MKFLARLPLFLLIFITLGALLASVAGAGERFKKLDAQGHELPDEAAAWAMVLDTKLGMYWEVKTTDDSIHSNSALYSWKDAKDKFIAQLNAEKFGGFDDWRIPASSELALIKVRVPGKGPYIDLKYFPNTQAARYMSQGHCVSNPGFREESIKFGKGRTKGGKYVRAFRGLPLE